MNWLLISLLLPVFGALFVAYTADAGREFSRFAALAISLATLGAVGVLMCQGVAGIQPAEASWLAPDTGFDVRFSLGLDGLSLWLFGLSALLTVTSVLVSWEAIRERAGAFYSLLLLLEAGMLGVFAARDVILFYLFFEFTLIPLFFLIGVWGSEERRRAAIKFFLFTFAGSVLTFLGLLAIVIWDFQHSATGVMRFSIPELTAAMQLHPIGLEWQRWIFLALFAGFAIKVPLFPLHTWLPLAHVQAPTAGSVVLAGILLKIGGYGFVRFSLAMLPDAAVAFMPWILWLSVAGIVYGALVALAQSDIKRLIAYSSVSHLGFVMLGLFSMNKLGLQGGVLQMINHGLSTGGLFAIVGMIYERYHTREIRQLGGIARRTPLLAAMMLAFTFSSIGLPGLNGFVGEFMILLGMFQRGWATAPAAWSAQWLTIAVLALSGVVLGAWYMLWLVERVFFGPLREPAAGAHDHHEPIADLNLREAAALLPLVVLMIWIGVAPGRFLEPIAATVDPLIESGSGVLDRAYARAYDPPAEAPLTEAPPPSASSAATLGDIARDD